MILAALVRDKYLFQAALASPRYIKLCQPMLHNIGETACQHYNQWYTNTKAPKSIMTHSHALIVNGGVTVIVI